MALQGLDLQIEQGELLAIIGKSGSGKSTLMNMIGGLERPTAGKLYLDGEDLYAKSDKEMTIYRREQVGFVWQMSSKNLIPYLPAVENVEAPMRGMGVGKEAMRERALSLLERVGLSHKKDAYPHQMSGGEQQRVAIAVALANEPKILLADEPTGALDTKTSNQIQDLFRSLNEELGITIIIVTHDMKLAHKVDRVLMISDGKISTEKVLKEDYRKALQQLEDDSMLNLFTHEEYSVLDKAGRLQLNDEMLEAAGIDGNRVKVEIMDGKVVISKE
ncbi:MAG: ABC transporter ATP-binding protein [Lachnospiraceae bacterium]|nr:ABC transporter ATP-binding protein [Lachnospiraceae bacterium]